MKKNYSLLLSSNPLYTKSIIEDRNKNVIKGIRIDSLINVIKNVEHNNIYMKIDVEGNEFDVLRSGEEFLKEYSSILIIETEKIKKIIRYLNKLNYNCKHIFKKYYLFHKE